MCNSYGFIKSASCISFDVLRNFQRQAETLKLKDSIVLSVSPKVFDYLVHNEYQSLLALEKILKCKIILESNEKFENSQFVIDKNPKSK